MKKKILSGILALAVMISCSNGISVSAETLQSTPENIISENDGQMEFLQISDEEVPATEIPETELNVEERNYTGTDLSLSSIMPYSENDDVSNADPNYAYLVENNNAYQGSIENEKEFRWYRFEITEKSKVTVFLQMAETLDADLYMFSLDTETYSLNLVGGSSTEGLGVSEHYADVLEPGIYYFAAGGYEGTGNFTFAFFDSAKDASYEVNDTLSTATNISIGSSAVGVLDSPLDIDYYKVSVTKGYIMKYSISTTADYSLVYKGKSGSNAAIYKVGNEDDKVLIMPQINRIRVNNVKYNFGTQYYDDFMMRFNCKNTIYDLANGGGKSLLMLLLLQNVIPNCTLDEKQPIEKLFRTGCDNTVIHSLVEWKLDACYRKDNYKYMTTGFCARKGHVRDEYAQEVESSDTVDISDSASIEYFNYCIFYRKFGDNDIKNIPLVKNGERVTYNGLKAYLRELEKNDFNVSVKIFDRKGDYQNFISRYGLFESEWEIIRGINKTEGHVRTYFETNYRTSRKVVEDLLIEEIIQKSFNNKLAVTDDEGKMAKTLLDIKDKLIELSKKNERISSYNSQMSALDDFAEYVSTFKEMYSKKEQLKKCLYNMLIKAHCMLITKDEYFTSVENEAESNRLSEEEEQRKI